MSNGEYINIYEHTPIKIKIFNVDVELKWATLAGTGLLSISWTGVDFLADAIRLRKCQNTFTLARGQVSRVTESMAPEDNVCEDS